jgi:hypothetical protein
MHAKLVINMRNGISNGYASFLHKRELNGYGLSSQKIKRYQTFGFVKQQQREPSTMTLAFGGVMTVISVGNLDDGPRLWRCVWFAFGSRVGVRCFLDGRIS